MLLFDRRREGSNPPAKPEALVMQVFAAGILSYVVEGWFDVAAPPSPPAFWLRVPDPRSGDG